MYFLLYSLPFEFLFRGVVQNLLHSWADSRVKYCLADVFVHRRTGTDFVFLILVFA